MGSFSISISFFSSFFIIKATLKAWLYEHRKNPYPTKNEKMILAMVTKMTLTQVSTWFANARRRLKKENKLHRTSNNSKSEEDDDDDDVVDDDVDDDVDENENDNESHINIPQEQTIKPTIANTNTNNNLKRKLDDDDTNSSQPPAKNRPKIWSIVDVVQSNETPKQTNSSSSPAHIIHPYITPSIPYLLYPPSSTSSPSHSSSEQSTNSLSSPVSSSTSCSPTK